MIPNQAEVQTVLEPYEEQFNEIILKGWEEAWAVFQQYPWRTSRGRANLVNDRVVDNALQVLLPRVQHIDRYHTVWFVIEDLYLARFKQFDENGLSRNVPTARARQYVNPNYELFGPIDWPRIEIGHVFNKTGTGIDNILVVARDRRRLAWSYPIWPTAQKTIVLPIIERVQPVAEDLWTARKDLVKKKSEANED